MNGSPPRAVFFDLDDTLIAHTETPRASWQEVFVLYSSRFDALLREKLLAAIFEYSQWFWSDQVRHKRGRQDLRSARREIVAGAFLAQKIDDPLLSVALADSFSIRREAAIGLFPHVIETLHCLRDQGLKLGLITNGESKGQRYKIDKFGLAPLFDVIQIEEEVGLGKPEPGVYELALRSFQLGPSDAWMVGDNLVWDIEAAQRTGLFAVWVDYDRQGLPADSRILPDRIIHSLLEL
jgi:putative hydrolase of the HAD superfamily